jgi:hypothetical protein
MVIIENVPLLKLRINKVIAQAIRIIEMRIECGWHDFVICNGKTKRVSNATAKKRFKARFIDRFREVLECLESNDFDKIDWVDYRDVLVACSYKANFFFHEEDVMRTWSGDIIIEVYAKEEKYMDNTLSRLAMRL